MISIDLSTFTGVYTSEPELGFDAPVSYNLYVQYEPIGGSSVVVSLETSVDEGINWIDIVKISASASGKYIGRHFVTNIAQPPVLLAPLSDNTVRSGFLGDRIRFVVTPTGAFSAGSTLIARTVPVYRGRNGSQYGSSS